MSKATTAEVKPEKTAHIATSLKAELKLKDSTVYPVGTPACIIGFNRGTVAVVRMDGARAIRLKSSYLHRYFEDFEDVPDDNTLQRWMFDGVVRSITGETVEPDGYGPDGAPSWLLALGLI